MFSGCFTQHSTMFLGCVKQPKNYVFRLFYTIYAHVCQLNKRLHVYRLLYTTYTMFENMSKRLPVYSGCQTQYILCF